MSNSTCCNSFPVEPSADYRVIICYYDQGWVPIKYCTLGKAVSLQHQSLLTGQELFIFPAASAPCSLQTVTASMAASQLHSHPDLKRVP